MNETRRFRFVSAVLFITLAVVLLGGKFAATTSVTSSAVNALESWCLVLTCSLLATALLPLNDALDRSMHVCATLLGVVALFLWLGTGNPTALSTVPVIVVLGGLGVVTRSVVRERWSDGAQGKEPRSAMGARLGMTAIILAVTVACVFYRWLVLHRLEQTSALFIGIPALLAILTTIFARPKSATGMLFAVTAIALLVSGIFLGEGFICILMASPLFFLMAAIVGAMTDWARRRHKPSQTLMSLVLIVSLTPMSLEGVRAKLSFPREEAVTRELVVAAPADEVSRRISATPEFGKELPAFLRLGFPRPLEAVGTGLNIGNVRRIHFAGGEGKPGDLVMRVTAHDASSVEFAEVADTSHVAHWMEWETTRFAWTALPDGTTRVTCTVRYRRLLDPAWYFKPWERYAVGLSNEYLLRSLTAPR